MPTTFSLDSRGSRDWTSSFAWRSKLSFLSGLCIAWLTLAEPACGQWMNLNAFRRSNSAKNAAESSSDSCVDTIRRLKREARQAADRGDLIGARRAAEQAHQCALNYRGMLTEFPDCAPLATAELLREFPYSTGVAPLEAQSPRPNADVLAKSLSQLSEDSAKIHPAARNTVNSPEPRLLNQPDIASAAQLPVRKPSATKQKRPRRRVAPRPIPADTESTPVEDAETEVAALPEPQFEYFQPAIQKPAPGGNSFTVEERQYETLEAPAAQIQPEVATAEVAPAQELSLPEQPMSPAAPPEEVTAAADGSTVTTAIGENENGQIALDLDITGDSESETAWPGWLDGDQPSGNKSPADETFSAEAVDPAIEAQPTLESETAPLESARPSDSFETEPRDSDADSEFFSEPESDISETSEMTRVTYSPANLPLPAAPRVPATFDAPPEELSPLKNVQPTKPSVVVADQLAVAWAVEDDRFEETTPRPRQTAWQRLDWKSLDTEEKIAIVGALLCACGATLFMAATRRGSEQT